MFFCVLFLLFPLITPKLLMVIEVFRHGAREPVYDYWNARSFREFGELTSVGMHQHYILGQEIRTRYIDTLNFLCPNHEPEELYVRSTDLNRTLASAISQLYGLYPLNYGPYLPLGIEESRIIPPLKHLTKATSNKRLWNKTFGLPMGFQPIAVLSVQEKDDELLRPYMPNLCPVNIMLEKRQKNSKKYQEWKDEFESTFHQLEVMVNSSDMTNLTITIDTASRVYDVFEADRYFNQDLPENMTEELWKNLTFISDMHLYYVKLGERDQQMFQATPFFQEVIASFDDKLSPNPSNYKFKMFSAHDMTLAYILTGLNLTSYKCLEEVFRTGKTKEFHCFSYPIFASSMFFELERDDESGEVVVRVRYNGEEVSLCGRRDTACGYREFKERLMAFMVKDFKGICKNRAKPEEIKFNVNLE